MTEVNWLAGVLFPYINFALFLFLLWRAARKPAHAAAEKRSEDYKALYEKATESFNAAKERLSALNKKYDALAQEVQKIEAGAKEGAKQQTAALLREAQKMSDHLDLEAQNIAKREAANAKHLLQEELWLKAKEGLLERVRTEFTVKKQKEYLWSSLADVKSLEK